MKQQNSLYLKLRHGIPMALFLVLYLIWFHYLERTVTKYHVIHLRLDDYIPFCEAFIVPYLLWFAYVAAVVIFLLFNNRQEYDRICAFLMTGMTLFLIISTLWPNGHHLRPSALTRDNLFSHLVALLYQADTPTNLWPSIHVYNSLGAHLGVLHCPKLARKKGIRAASLILTVSIILSTMLLKQHSVFDVATGLLFGGIMYLALYKRDYQPAPKMTRLPQRY